MKAGDQWVTAEGQMKAGEVLCVLLGPSHEFCATTAAKALQHYRQ